MKCHIKIYCLSSKLKLSDIFSNRLSFQIAGPSFYRDENGSN